MYNMELDIGPEGERGIPPDTFDPLTTPYEVDEGEFPWYESAQDQFAFLLRYAILAPSSHNTQPWKFGVSNEGIAVYADYARRLPVVDPEHRELIMSVGAAISNLRVAAAHYGCACTVEYNQTGDSELPLAFLRLMRSASLPAEAEAHARLFPAITKRHTNRAPFLMARLPEQLILSLNDVTHSALAAVYVSRDGSLNQRVADLVARGDRTLQSDRSYRRELAEWMRPNHTQRSDGITGASLGVNDLASAVGPWAVRAFDLGRIRAARDKNLCLEAPGLIVLCSEDAPLHWLETGEVLERILLLLTLNGVHFSFLNMPVEVPGLRQELRSLLPLSLWPQVLLRIGYSLHSPARSPRRTVEACVVHNRDNHPSHRI